MAISFPSNPTTNQTYTHSGKIWTYNGTRWITTGPNNFAYNTPVAPITVSDTVPGATSQGSLWVDSTTGTLSVYIGGAWVLASAGVINVAANSIPGSAITANSITASQLVSTINLPVSDYSVTASKIANYTITGQQVSNSITFGNVTATGNTALANVTVSATTSLGAVGNVKITGGTSGQLISTDGNGNLSFVTQSVPTTLGNITVSNAAIFSNTANFTGLVTANAATFTGLVTVTQGAEVIASKTAATGVVAHDLSTATTFYHTSPSANFTANFTNVSTTDNRVIVVAIVITQGATAYIPTAVQIDGTAQTIKWISSTAATGTASKVDVISFSLIRSGGAWIVLGQNSNYG